MPARARISLVAVSLGTLAGLVLSGCSVANSATVDSRPTPVATMPHTRAPHTADQPSTRHERRHPRPRHTVSPKPSRHTTRSPSPTPTPTRTPDGTTFALIRAIKPAHGGGFTVIYDPAVHCTKTSSDSACAHPPAEKLPGGAWIVDTDPATTTIALAEHATGQLYPAGITFSMKPADLAEQPVRNGYVARWPSIQVPAFLTVKHGKLTKVSGYLLSE